MLDKLIHRIKRKLIKLRLQPIRVFCFHQTSETFDASTMYPGDWTQIEQFKRNIIHLKEQYTFISLPEAYDKLTQDRCRRSKYAVLTADDGWLSLKNILPWLAEQQIPITLFVNPAYLRGDEERENGMNGLLSAKELDALIISYPNITIASHGWNHTLVTDVDDIGFLDSTIKSMNYLKQFKYFISYYAYPCGRHTESTDAILGKAGIVPVYMDGRKDYVYDGGIHRELLDGLSL